MTDPMDTPHPMGPIPLPGLEDLEPPRPPAERGGAAVEAYVRAQIAEANRDAGPLPRPGGRAISPDQARTMVRHALLEAGWHPLTRGPLTDVDGATCGSCAHLVRVGHNRRAYSKCELVGITRGPGTDLRTSWPGCERWEPLDGGERP